MTELPEDQKKQFELFFAICNEPPRPNLKFRMVRLYEDEKIVKKSGKAKK
jgi:hypothetical protein